MTTHKEPLFPFALEEGRARDWLADKLLSLPALEDCTAEETEEWRRALELLWETEIRSVLQCRGLNRPLRYGNLGEMTYSVLEASRLVSLSLGCPLSYRMNRCCVCSAFEPRLLQLSIVGLLRSRFLSRPGAGVNVQVRFTARHLLIRVSGDARYWDSDTIAVTKETARLHHGSLAVSDHTLAFSLRLLEKSDKETVESLQEPSTPAFLLRQPLSCVNVGYRSLNPSLFPAESH